MKRWKSLILLLLLAGIIYVIYLYRHELGLVKATELVTPADWRVVNRAGDGFQIDMPSSPKDLQVPAQNESGGTEPVNMLVATPTAEVTYSIAWADNPPVMRVNSGAPDRILAMAQNQELARTQTTLVSESPTSQNGLPARELVAQNAGGGIIETRLIYAEGRLYMLSAAYPSMDARREQDVIRFFNSFKPSGSSAIPQTLPLASVPRARR